MRDVKLGRWAYCKYCYKSIVPEFGPDGSIVVCPDCGHGLAPVDEVRKAGSLSKWVQQVADRPPQLSPA